ncbi:hypothetical protein DRW07_14225 [Alteromonas sediminis]|uniref:Uncharacterized protein n=1 Tax=Alteromonas sediminis TaxID=2259342 RepID=A0A3N5YLG1_9ALTE|nr:hypothetical protein [Alteromonas sediminis]RPJ65961.1 hypothetical protein DRW07_14225 [Alteromonas sediminis]
MELKTLFKASAVSVALILAGCGGDISITPTVNDNSSVVDNSTNNSNNTSGQTPSEDVNCASYEGASGTVEGVFDGLDCIYNDSFASRSFSITSNITFEELPNGGVHFFEDALQIGEDGDTTAGFSIPTNGPTMTVRPGATLAFQSGEAIIRIARGAKIQAVGTASKPITFTSANAFDRFDNAGGGALYADWGGIIINGNAITDQCSDAERDAGTCNVPSEGIVSYYGGNDNTDSSGSIKWARIWYAGSGPRAGGEGDDLNSLTLNGVGSGSEFEYLHIHQGFDDGVEIFGGATTLKYIVVTDTQDDSFDFDASWQGAAQFLYVKHGTVTNREGAVVNMGNGGFESDGRKGDGPSSNPTIANVTVVTTDELSVRDEDPSLAFKFDDQFNASLYNVLMVKTDATQTWCVNFSGDGELGADQISFTGSVMACGEEFNNDTFGGGPLEGTALATWFDNDGANERIGPAASVFAEDGFSTLTSSSDISVAASDLSDLDSSFFTPAAYVGAVSDQDTSSAWYQWVQAALTAADAD